MSQQSFQAALARMVVDPDFRELVRRRRERALDTASLTPLERERLVFVAADRGYDFTRSIHKSFRLTKLYTMLPLTRALLGPARLTREIAVFWSGSLPVSHYFVDESVAFCDHLDARLRSGLLRVKYLSEIVAYERANLELRRPRPAGEAAPHQTVSFRFDPVALLGSLASGRRPRGIARANSTLVGSLDADGSIQWDLAEETGMVEGGVGRRSKHDRPESTRETRAASQPA